jgi:Mg/Co/Ni transporter MgtE
MIYKSICFSVDDIYFLVKNMKKSKEKIFQNIINNEIKKIIEKLFIEDNFNKLKSLKNSKEKQINKEIDSLSKPSNKKNKS